MSPQAQWLSDCAVRTLEDMCFFSVSNALTDEQTSAHADGAMEVRFRGPRTGRLVVRLAGGMLPVLANNMLGDADGTPAMQQDALGELANVICGNLLPLISGVHAIYDITAARSTVILNTIAPVPTTAVHLGLEQTGRADLYLFLDAEAAA